MLKRFSALFTCSALAFGAMVSVAEARKDDDTLVWATATEIDTFDIYYQGVREVVIATMYNCDSLLHRDPASGKYLPLLAESHRWVDDLTLELDLRKGVKFHNGADFTAEDVAYTFRHAMKPDSGIAFRAVVDWIKSVEVINPHRVRLLAKAPTPAALDFLAGNTAIYPAGHYDKAPVVTVADGKTRRDWGAVRPVCTGPYMMTDFKAGSSATFTKNPNYFKDSPKGQPTIGKIIYRTIADNEAQLAELLTGSIDWVWGVAPSNVAKLSAMPNVTVKTAPTARMSFLALDAAGRTGDTPMKDARVRRAIFHAIDREAITKLVGNSAELLKSMCYPTQVGCSTDVTQYPYDPTRAKALLAEAGYPNGLKIPFYAYRDRPYSEAVLAYLRNVGIQPDFRFIQYVALRPLIIGNKTELAHLSWGSQGLQDASASVSNFFGGGEDDYARDPEVKSWLSAADSSMDLAKRNELYAKALEKINKEAYAVPLFAYGRAYAFNSELDYKVTSDEIAHFYLAAWKR